MWPTERTRGLVLAGLLSLVVASGSQAITVSGHVTSDCDVNGVEDVQVSIFDTGTGSSLPTCTDENGYYEISGLSSGVSLYLGFDVPSGYRSTTPSFIVLSGPTGDQIEDFSLTCIQPTVSGRVSSDCEPGIAGVAVVLTLSDGSTLQAQTDASGYYSFAAVNDQAPSEGCVPGATPSLSVVPPGGYTAISPTGGTYSSFILNGNRLANFRLQCPRVPTYVYFEDFENGDAGWHPTGSGPASFRLEQDPPCNGGNCPSNGSSWVAYQGDPPLVPLADSGQTYTVGIESPEIPIPSDTDLFGLSFCWYRNGFDYSSQHYIAFKVVSINASDEETVNSNNFVYYAPGVGWDPFSNVDLLRKPRIGGLIEADAVRIKIQLLYVDNPFLLTGTRPQSEAPYFDNVLLTAYNTNAAPVTIPGGITCPISTEVSTVTISGTVSSDCQGTIAGVPVGLELPSGDWLTATTGASGEYSFDDVPSSPGSGEVSISAPLGFEADTPTDGLQSVTFLEDRVVDFTLGCVETTSPARGLGYWKHQAAVYVTGNGRPQETEEDMTSTYPMALFDHFHQNSLAAIQVPGVTYIEGEGGAHVPITIETIYETLHPDPGASALDRARQHYLILLLNVASGRLRAYDVASEDGRTVSQGIQEIASLILDGDTGNDERALAIGVQINGGGLVSAGLIGDQWETIYYRLPTAPAGSSPSLTGPLSVFPSPLHTESTIGFRLAEPGPVRLQVVSATGALVRHLLDEPRSAGWQTTVWDGRDDAGRHVPSGIYYVRMEAGGAKATSRVVVLR